MGRALHDSQPIKALLSMVKLSKDIKFEIAVGLHCYLKCCLHEEMCFLHLQRV